MRKTISILLFLFLTISCSKKEEVTNEQPIISEFSSNALPFGEFDGTYIFSPDNYYGCNKSETIELNVVATDIEGDEIIYEWNCNGGSFINANSNSNKVLWKAPSQTSSCGNSNIPNYQEVGIEVFATDKFHEFDQNPNKRKWLKLYVKCN